ncbi:MAG: ABC transporter substrate-binding protein [Alphaproteobacteria bacterium]|nr:ABC transporter substrate-binding protein [Alphaproteobacteria bacterium]
MTLRRLVVATVLALALPIGAAGAQSQLRIALQDDPDSLDPALNWSFVGRHVLQSLCDKLVDIDQQGNIVPMLAASWRWAEGGKRLTLTLRDDARYHDGEPLDAASVKANIERMLTMKTSRRRAEIDVVESVEAPDPRTVDIRLARASVPLLAAFTDRAGMMVSPKAAEAAGERFGQKPICAGPYRFVERVAQDRIVLDRDPAHWRAARYAVDRLVFRGIPDSTVRLTNLRAGTLDLIERLGPTDYRTVQDDKALAITEVSGLGYYNITFNMANGAKANPSFAGKRELRDAFALAIDRDAINRVAFDGRFETGNQPFPPTSPYYNRSLPVPTRDLAAARARVAAAGVANPTLELLVPTDPQRQQVAEMMQAMLAEAGITLKIVQTELMSLLARAREGNFEAHLVGWSGRVDPDLNITPLLACKAAGNDGHYCNPALEAILGDARASGDAAQRKAAYDRAIALLLEDKPVVYLYHAKWIFAHRARVTGFAPAPDGIIRLDGVKLAP